MTRTISFGVIGRPTSPNETRRKHWGSRARDAAVVREAAFISAREAARRSGFADDLPFRRTELTLVFVLAKPTGDLDNLLAGSKPIIDGISRGMGTRGERGPLIWDDGVATLQRIDIRWRLGRIEGVEVHVKEVTDL